MFILWFRDTFVLVDILEKFWEIWEKSSHVYEDFLVLDVDLVLCFYFEFFFKKKIKSSVEICANDFFIILEILFFFVFDLGFVRNPL